jgi:ABC-type glycerol-3-phosphate transport system substrate-binding protein
MKIISPIKNLNLKQSTIALIVLAFGVTGMIFLIDQTPAPLNQKFASETLIQPTFDYPYIPSVYGVPTYTAKHHQYVDQGFPRSQYETIYENEDILGDRLSAEHETYGTFVESYHEYIGEEADVYLLNANRALEIEYDHPFAALSFLAVDYFILDQGTEDTKIDVQINDAWQFYESQAIILPSSWQFTTEEFALDRYNNELQPLSTKVNSWQRQSLRDMRTLHAEPFAFFLDEGDQIKLSFVNANVLIGRIYVINPEPLPTYQSYRQTQPNAPVVDTLSMISSRSMVTRTDASIRLRTEQDASALYYNTQFLRLNTIFGDSWERGGQAITYHIDIATSGYYALSFRYRQYLQNDMVTMRSIYINGEIPFQEFLAMSFPYTMQFRNRTLARASGEPYFVYFEVGTHTITLEAVNYAYRFAIETLQYIMQSIQALALEIKRYTAGSNDLYRDWEISTYFPNAANDLRNWADELDMMYTRLLIVSINANPSQLSNVKVSSNRLRTIANQVNRLPGLMVQFSDGDSSVNQMLGALLQELMRSNLEIERIMVHGDIPLPRATSTFFVSAYQGAARLVLSFVNNPYSATQMNEDQLNVWVNFPRPFIEIMQTMIDQFYPGTREVKLSQMPDENKLILSNISGQSPDIAVGINHWIPYDFASRDAALDLRQFSGFTNTVQDFSKGAMIPYIFEEGVYGLPLTQNFWVTFYRRDIMESIGINSIPQTWDEVIGILPLLQSYGLNYFLPLSQFSGLKPFVATLPFIHQFGGQLYAEDGMSTTINEEKTLQGITLMAELFTLYNIPKFVASFYNQFRYGTLPIGIGDLGTYLLLSSAASELDGLWAMDLHPGYRDPLTQTINRSSATGAQGSMILANTNLPDESWDFLSWWMSTPIQALFGQTLQSTYGKTYFWNSANLDAFAQSSMPQPYKDVVLAQWEYALEASRIPGTYMVERELSNAWTNIVFNGINPRQAIDEAVRISNREIIYKMAEFGYTNQGQVLKPYLVPTLENINRWLVAYA